MTINLVNYVDAFKLNTSTVVLMTIKLRTANLQLLIAAQLSLLRDWTGGQFQHA